jgi:putative glutamine amidotransferase
VIEAVELPGQRFCVAVQWHPEMTAAADPVQQRLFAALVEEAILYADKRR